MALKFFNDYERVNKQPDPTPAPPDPAPATMTVDDMKAYFDTMKESLINEIKEQLKSTAVPIDTTEKEGDTNASNTDLLNS